MGRTIEEQRVLDAPMLRVLEVVRDVASYPQWAPGMQEVQVLESDAQGRVALARFRADGGLVQLGFTLAYEHTADGMRWWLAQGELLSQLDGSYRLTPQPRGTLVEYRIEVDIDLPLPGVVKEQAARRILAEGVGGLARHLAAQP